MMQCSHGVYNKYLYQEKVNLHSLLHAITTVVLTYLAFYRWWQVCINQPKLLEVLKHLLPLLGIRMACLRRRNWILHCKNLWKYGCFSIIFGQFDIYYEVTQFLNLQISENDSAPSGEAGASSWTVPTLPMTVGQTADLWLKLDRVWEISNDKELEYM